MSETPKLHQHLKHPRPNDDKSNTNGKYHGWNASEYTSTYFAVVSTSLLSLH